MSENAGTELLERSSHDQGENPAIVRTGTPVRSKLRRLVGRPMTAEGSIPHSVGTFRIGDKIGAGAEGTVHIGRRGILRKPVALKLDTSEMQTAEDNSGERTKNVTGPKLANLQEEADVLNAIHRGRLRRPKHVVRILGAGKTGRHRLGEKPGVGYMAVELAGKGSLSDLLRNRGGLSIAEATNIASQLASALETTHERGFVHADLKPANVLVKSVRKDIPHVILGDYGAAGKERDTNFVKYTPMYAAPEQMRGKIRYAGDIYTLGVLLYELETGEKLYNFDPDDDMVRSRLKLMDTQTEYDAFIGQRLQGLRDVSPDSVALLESMLQLDPEKRPDIKSVKQTLTSMTKRYAKSRDITYASTVPTEPMSIVHADKTAV